MFEDDPNKPLVLTALEETVWTSAYTANQPQPRDENGRAANRRTGLAEDYCMPLYWAAAAVFHLRGNQIPSYAECTAMFRYMQEKNRRQHDALKD